MSISELGRPSRCSSDLRRRRGLRCFQFLVIGFISTVEFLTHASWPLTGRAFLPVGGAQHSLSGRGNIAELDMNRPSSLFDTLGVSAAVAAITCLAGGSPVHAQAVAQSSSESQFPFAIAGAIVAIVAVVVALLGSGGQDKAVDDKKVVEEYFNGEGFGRWKLIYGETDDVNAVQKDIRDGHAVTLEKILDWLDTSSISGKTVCDAGCGTGNLSIPLASRGARVSGSDISKAMVTEAQDRSEKALQKDQMPQFKTSDLEALDGEYDTVCCVDVLIHYPPERLDAMVGHLASLSKERLILSFAPKTWYYTLLKRVGELFPGKSKTTRAYLHEEEIVEEALRKAGFEVTRKEMTATNFYFSRLFEAKPAA